MERDVSVPSPLGVDGEQVVVAVALVDDRRQLLACCRAEPSAVAGYWEFPGGKVEPGEDDSAAAVRECREELGVDIQLGPLLGEVALSRTGWTLRVWYGRVLTGTPQALDHAELRWLGVEELGDVPWLPADIPLVDEVRRRLADPTSIFPDRDLGDLGPVVT
jgi:8-oxo-dGTP diphosphatase